MFFSTSSLNLCPTPRFPGDILTDYSQIRAGNLLDESGKFDSLHEMSMLCQVPKGSIWNNEYNSACEFLQPIKKRSYADEKEA